MTVSHPGHPDPYDAAARRIARLRRSPLRAAFAGWHWRRTGRHLEALAVLDGPRALPAMFAVGLHRSFLETLGGRDVRGRLLGARGIARLATGDVDAAKDDLLRSCAEPAGFGLWLRCAASLAQVDPTAARAVVRGRREPAATLLQAHLQLLGGDLNAMETTLAGLRLAGGRAAESDLLRANLASARDASDAAEMAAAQALARFGLAPFNAPDRRIQGPAISVIVAVHNAERTIADALNSLRRQHWSNLEIVVVDDASSDATVAQIDALAAQEPRIRLLRQPINAGAYVARNVGLAAATGAFIAFHDADDLAHPERLARQVQPLLNDPRLGFTTARWTRRTGTGMFANRQIAPLIRQHVGSFLVRRSVFDAVGAFDPVRFGGDGEMLLRLTLASQHRALPLPLTIGGYDEASAVHHPDTGYGERGFAPGRLDYVEHSTWRLIAKLRKT